MNGRFLAAALVVSSVFVLPCLGQGSRLVCTANSGLPPVVRSEGLTELAGDILLFCSGLGLGSLTTDLIFRSDTPITSRNYNPGQELALLIDDPGAPPNNIPAQPGVNLFQPDSVTSSEIRFNGVRLAFPATESSVRLRLVNLRLDASRMPQAPSPQTNRSQIMITASSASLTINYPNQTTAYSQQGLVGDMLRPAGSIGIGSCGGSNEALASSSSASGGVIGWVARFREGFQPAFKRHRMTGQQNAAGQVYINESGFYDTTLSSLNGLNRLGLADSATRLMARFTNVPAGVRLYVTTELVAPTGGYYDSSRQAAVLVSAGPDGTGGSLVAATTTALFEGTPVGIAPLTAVNGTAVAAWDVREQDPTVTESFQFGVLAAWVGGNPQAAGIRMELFLGPISPGPVVVPRFADPSGTALISLVNPCTPGVDLAAGAPNFVETPGAGAVTRIDSTIANRGLTASGGFSFATELLDVSGAVIARDVRAINTGLQAGESRTVRVPLRTRIGTVPGTVQARLTVDEGNTSGDADRSNNQAATSSTMACRTAPLGNLAAPAVGGPLPIPAVSPFCTISMDTGASWETPSQPATWLQRDSGGGPLLRLATNGSRSPRWGFATGSGRYQVQQAGADPGCSFALASGDVSSTVAATGGTRILNIQTGTGCGWSAVANARMANVPGEVFTGPAAITVQIRPNFSTLARNVPVVAGNWSGTIPQAGNSRPANERLVQLIYFYFLGRLPSESEISLQAGELNRGTELGVFLPRFYNAVEFDANSRFVAGLYVGLLNRTSELNGFLFQRNALLTQIVTQQQLVANFLNSAEWKLNFGTLSDAGFVRFLYQYVLLRAPSQAEVDFQAAALGGGTSRVQMATNFLNAPEFRAGVGPRLTAFLAYATILGRDADPGELSAAVDRLKAGLSPTDLLDELTRTAEFTLLAVE